ncbi:phosphatidate cytidylyltransferase [Virgibacillus phasianinus]|uniref:Phosphatidate cytidylyltransferase n=1 Tax=Virgibacillus phasianinus TaxID=2017483 RepID=A0A220U684_9BACI|nr:phosphatidate cytidylyltransferase [Virgibacillus phasianinus]ASK63492.1 phosphatidate cytidylyltransferase [Virgibacillus phasianinus]
MKQRTLTAILALIIFVPFVIVGGLPFTIFVYFMATIALIELLRMRKVGKYSIPAVLAILILWLLLPDVPADIVGFFTKSELVMMFAMLLLSYTVLVKNKFTFEDAGFIMLATIYVGMGFFYLIETRDDTNIEGLVNIFYVLLVIWATDTGAYLFGRAFGKRKLWPMISPNKTVEGAIGGILISVVVGVIFHFITPFEHSLIIVIGVTILVSIFGQIGDLVESAFKRHYGVKDSGNILPGHGGILDRLDSLLFVLPLIHFIHFI